jgi:hypothetical protein
MIVCILAIFVGLSSAVEKAATGEWIKSFIAKQDGVQVVVSSANINGVFLYGTPKGVGVWKDPSVFSEEDFLQIYVYVKNTNMTKKLDFISWRGNSITASNGAKLTDNYTNNYKRIAMTADFDEKYSRLSTTIYPNEVFRDLLVFERPIPGVQWLHLELPATNYGGTGILRFEIPANKIPKPKGASVIMMK